MAAFADGAACDAETEVRLTPNRRPYVWLLAIFALSRTGYYALGVRFDASTITHFFQFIDPELLKHRLLESMYYLHMQPPGYNLYTGTIMKLFPNSYPVAFHAIHLVLGATIVCLTYYLMSVCGVRSWLGVTLASIFIVSPGVVLFENFMLYEYLLVFLLLSAAALLYRFCRDGTTLTATLFFACLLCLLLLRNHFHLIYIVGAFVLLLYFMKQHRRTILVTGTVPVCLALTLYVKNWVYFDSFSSSTWMGFNMSTITTHQLTDQEASDLVGRGVISPVSLMPVGTRIEAYRPYIHMPAKTSIPVLDDEITSTGVTNFNHLAFLQIDRYYMQSGLAVLRHFPVAYLRSIEKAWFAYFLPTGDFPFFDLNRPRIYWLDRLFNVVVFGQFKDASDRKHLRSLEAHGAKLGLVFYTGIFLLIGLPVLWLWGIWRLVSALREKQFVQPTVILTAFLVFNITYLTAVANFLSSFENNRYRFQIDAFFVVLLGTLIEQALQKAVSGNSRRRPANFSPLT